MHARVMIGQVKPNKLGELDNGINTYQNSVVPGIEQQKGFKGSFLFTNPHTGKAISITLWETEADMMDSEAGEYFQEQVEKIGSVLAGPGIMDHFQLSVQTGS
jgi:heme-degrading monooxygenase HmoA